MVNQNVESSISLIDVTKIYDGHAVILHGSINLIDFLNHYLET